jgi:hypothetical protein
MSLNVVPFPDHYAALDIPDALRALADEIEAGNHGAAFNLLWVIDKGDGAINVGLMGKTTDVAFHAHFLAHVAMLKIVGEIGR